MLPKITGQLLGLVAASVALAAPTDGLPSEPGPHVARIEQLGDDSWLHLGVPAADPKWGKARGRSWGAKMPYAPDLRAAFLYGEGVHGWWNKKTGRYMDDLWLYDINAHRWVCVYPGVDVPSIDLTLDKNGFETTRDGQLIPVAEMVHGYENLTYDTDARQFLFMPCPGNYPPFNKKRAEWLKGRDSIKIVGASPFAYDVAGGRWQRRATAGPSPRSGFGHVLVYVPEQKRAFFWGSGADVWFYDRAKNSWTRVRPKGPPPPFGIDPTATYDPKRQRIYMGGGNYPVAKGNALWAYDLKADAWIDLQPKGTAFGGNNHYNTNTTTMAYDPVADVVVMNRFRGETKELGLYAYDPEANAWLDRRKQPGNVKWKCVNAFYDPVLNVHVYHNAHDSEDDGTVWVYRYSRKK